MDKKKLYAAYGSNMNILQMKTRCPAAEKINTGIIKNYKLAFRHGGVATIIPAEGFEVPVVLWNISKECERRLDIYEGYPRLYIKDNVQIVTRTGIVTAMVYLMADNYSHLRAMPSDKYFETIKEGYLDNKIDLRSLNEAYIRSANGIYQ